MTEQSILGSNLTVNERNNALNKLETILESLSEATLKKGVRELAKKQETGILENGVIRELAQKIVREVGIPFNDSLTLAERAVIEKAAFKWANS